MELEIGFYSKMKYKDELIKSMNFLSEKKDTIFIGQSVKYSGNAIFNTLKEVSDKKKIGLVLFIDIFYRVIAWLARRG